MTTPLLNCARCNHPVQIHERFSIVGPSPTVSFSTFEIDHACLGFKHENSVSTIRAVVTGVTAEDAAQHWNELQQNARQSQTDTQIIEWLESQLASSQTGISFDRIPPCEGEPGGTRFMHYHHICHPGKGIRGAVEKAMKELLSQKQVIRGWTPGPDAAELEAESHHP